MVGRAAAPTPGDVRTSPEKAVRIQVPPPEPLLSFLQTCWQRAATTAAAPSTLLRAGGSRPKHVAIT